MKTITITTITLLLMILPHSLVSSSNANGLITSPSSSHKSAEINLPGFGEVDLDRFTFKLPTLPALSGPSLPNISFPTLPKLFSEVPCVSLVTARTGVCRKADDCSSNSGVSDGPCALGLGVCCTRPFACGQTVASNNSIIANPGYPEATTKSDLCTITIMKHLTTAQIRLDFEAFDIAGVDQSGKCTEDVMEITGSNPGQVVPRICGLNNGQHMYIHVEKAQPLTPVLIKFIFSQTTTARLFRIRVTQLGKDHPDLAPTGCLQYFMGQTGVVRSFNYENNKNVGVKTIKGLMYGVCFRKEAGFCSIRLDPRFTRSTRSAPAYAPAAAAPSPSRFYQHQVQHQTKHPVYYRPMFLRRPVLYHHHPYGRSFSRPVVYRPLARAPTVYMPRPMYPVSYPVHYPEEKKIVEKKVEDKIEEKIDAKKDAIEELFAQKKKLIEELFPSLVTPVEAKKDIIEDLLAQKKKLIDELLHPLAKKFEEKIEEKVVEKVAPSSYYPAPASHYPAPAPYYPVEKKPIEKKVEDKKEAVEDLLAQKTRLIAELFPSLKLSTVAPTASSKSYVIPATPLDLESARVCEGKDVVGVPPSAFICAENARPVVISTPPFAMFVDNRGEELSRGFSFAYTQQICS